MTANELIQLMSQSHRRVHVIGTLENGIIAALDLEGRLFTVMNAEVVSRVVPSAIVNRSNGNVFHNPGGDALWPAPEGNCFGYEYNTGKWRVPPSITGAVWEVLTYSDNKAVIKAEIDLVNNQQLGIPCEFERHIEINFAENSMTQHITEIIRYVGIKELVSSEFRLAPWSLCQFDSGAGSKFSMLPPTSEDVRDMYDSSLSKRELIEGKYMIDTNTDFRFQLGFGKNVEWIEYLSGKGFKVKRFAGLLPLGQSHIDIADVDPSQFPSYFGDKLSVYCDPSGFVEIEACGGCPETLKPGIELRVNVTTEFIPIAQTI